VTDRHGLPVSDRQRSCVKRSNNCVSALSHRMHDIIADLILSVSTATIVQGSVALYNPAIILQACD